MTARDQVFAGTASRASDFVFNEKVAAVFDDMLVRSVPFYVEIQLMVREMGKRFYLPGTCIYDLGSSTGTTLLNLRQALGEEANQLIGYDNSEPMIAKAKEKIKERGFENA